MPVELSYRDDRVNGDDIDSIKEALDRYQISFDFVLAYGGDGSFTYALRKYKKPVLPISKIGSVGFISDNTLGDIENCLEKLERGDYEIQRIPRIDGIVKKDKKKTLVGSAVNDVYMIKRNPIKTISYTVNMGYDRFSGRSDGIIIFTPIGSTAYNRSVRGPKIDYGLDAFGLSEIAPSLNDGLPSVFNASRTIEIEITRDEGVISIDGSDEFRDVNLTEGDVVICRKSNLTSDLIRVNPKKVSAKLKRTRR